MIRTRVFSERASSLWWKQQPDPHEKKTKGSAPRSVVVEDLDDGWPGYEEPAIIYH
jgi:hypothetical protein